MHYVRIFGILNRQLKNSKKTKYADVAELADAHGSGPCRYCFGGGSNPLIRTNRIIGTRQSTYYLFLQMYDVEDSNLKRR